ncbi:MAG: UDP-N-acetylglucosamine 2-epimerase (non-hydrolyzing) [bacterium]
MKIAIILGTRPEIIKMSPIIRELQNRKLDYFILHTNQHYSAGMDKVFFDELQLPQPRYNLDVHDLPQGTMVGKMLIGIEPILEQEKPDWVLVEGDTNTVLAGALAAAKLGIKVGHIEAGLRSYDRAMPEELNRIVADHLSDALFCPTHHAAQIAIGEGILKNKVTLTGNTIVDALKQNLVLARQSIFANKYSSAPYLLLTMHRPHNVDTYEALTQAIQSLEGLADELGLPIIFPVHPRTSASLKRFALTPDPVKIKLIEPVSYLEMLILLQGAKLIVTDSGGIQEEACILRVPCITIRDNTERPETVSVGANLIVGNSKAKVIEGARTMLAKPRDWPNPFGDGHTAEKIIKLILS